MRHLRRLFVDPDLRSSPYPMACVWRRCCPGRTVKLVREGPTPAETLRKVLDDDAFDPVRLALTKVDKGPLAGYTYERDGFDLVEAAGEPAESES